MNKLRWAFWALFIGCGMSAFADEPLKIVDNTKSAYRIIYANGNTTAETNAKQLQTAIKNVTGCTLTMDTDASAVSAYEIILGPSNQRTECASINAQITNAGSFGYRINIVGTKIVITASDANHLVLALKRFEDEILKSTTLAGAGFLMLDKAHTQAADFSHTQATLRNIVAYDLKYALSLSLCVSVPRYSSAISVSQGACTDGTYVYFVIRNSGDTQAVVYKYKMSNWSYVSQTAIFNGGHCNDLLYDWPNRRILCLHANDSNGKTKAINPATMAVSDGPNLAGGATAADYNPVLGLYIHRYGTALTMRDAALNVYKTGSRGDGLNMTTQGMGTDDDYFYFPNSPKNGETFNVLAAYDWKTCTWKKNITVPGSAESEGMFEWDGIYYVTYYEGSGAKLYKLNVTLYYTAGV